MIAMGAGSLTELTRQTVNVALGSSSPVVVEQSTGAAGRSALALADRRRRCARCWPGGS